MSSDTAVRFEFRRIAFTLAWLAIMLLAVRFIRRDALRYFGLDEAIFGRFWPDRFYLLPHVLGGILGLSMGPFQFWSGLRRRALQVHRWTGRLYLLGVLLASSTAYYLSFHIPPSDGGAAVGVSLFTLAAVWMIVSAMALIAIFHSRQQAHKEWMIRSYVLTFSFVNFRWWLDFPGVSHIGSLPDQITTVTWLGWALPLFLTEVVLHWKSILRRS